MKILVVQDSDWLKRNFHQQHHLFDRLSVRGHEIHVIDFPILWREDKTDTISKLQVFENVHKVISDANITLIRPGIVKLPLLDYISMYYSYGKEIVRQIIKFRPDVVVGFGIITSHLAVNACLHYRIPFVYYWIDVLHNLIPIKSLQSIGKMFEKQTLNRADKVITINQSLNEYVLNNGAKKSLVIGAGVDKSFTPRDGSVIRKKFGFKDSDIVLFFMGWLYKFSGVRELACEVLKTENIKLLIVGDGDDYSDIPSDNSKVILTGRKPYSEIPDLISASDICVLPSYIDEPTMQDIVPIKIYEYMAMGKPVIATRLPGLVKEFGYDNGISYVDNPKNVLNRVKDIKNSGLLKQLGYESLEYVKNRNWESIADVFERELNEISRIL